MTGGIGADLIRGGAGVDVYVYKLGHGIDTYSEQSGDFDFIRLGPGITKSDVSLARVSNGDLRIDIDTGTRQGTILIEDQFNYAAGGGAIEQLKFAGGGKLRLDQQAIP